MEAVAHLDTHLVAWLYQGDRKRLRPFEKTLKSHGLTYSPMVELELQYLYDIGRITASPDRVIAHLTGLAGLQRSTAEFGQVVELARAYAWTRDPFDRLIVATAAVDGARLLTIDQTILDNCSFARSS